MITAIILDGLHRNTVIRLPAYLPEIRVPKTATVSLVEQQVNRQVTEHATYKAVFHAVDQQVVLYSRTGHSMDFLNCDAVHPVLTGDGVGRRALNHFIRVEDAP